MIDVSVLVCTRNRQASLRYTLESIARAIAEAPAATRIELVVVDNGSTDGTVAFVEAWLDAQPFPGRLVLEPRPGIAVARNTAIRAAAGTLLLFTDDDCRLDPAYISTALALDASEEALVLRGGRVELGDATDLPVSVLTGTERQRWSKDARSARFCNIGIALLGASMMMRRPLVDRVGFFDERFGSGGPFKGGEEIDFLYRTYAAGLLIEYEPAMVVYHHHGRKSLGDAKRLATAYCRGDGALLAKFLRHDFVLKPLIWDLKKALGELRGGASSRPDLHVSHWRRLWEMGHGAADYWLSSLKPARSGAQR